MSSRHLFITGALVFSSRKTILNSGEESFFVRTRSFRSELVHGDVVKAKIVKRGTGGQLPEVEIITLLRRTEEVLLATITEYRGKRYLEVRKEQGNFRKILPQDARHYNLGDIVACRFLRNGEFKVLHRFASEGEYDIDERLILFLSGARTEFSKNVLEESEMLLPPVVDKRIPENEYLAQIFKQFSFSEGEIPKLQEQLPLFSPKGSRMDFRNWYTLTIDGADAKDLDDAISLAQDTKGNILLGVHIADVSEYVTEGTELDKEAYTRATSIYTPGKVIPMLPEKISNDLCSLHPGSPKYTLSCLILLDASGNVKQSEIVEGIIESQEKGIYEEIYKNMSQEKRDPKNKNKDTQNPRDTTISLATELYEILKKRRQKEGKIIFESTEIRFLGDTHTGIQVSKRERNDAHMMIEEFMVLANEEVAKWCTKHELPFLSRVHGLPSHENSLYISEMIGRDSLAKKLESHHIREYMEKITDPVLRFRFSHLLLPKMAKAVYSDKAAGHFGLALSYYSHFTSPIRRYPDLQIHRIIKEVLRQTLDTESEARYRSILKRVARHCSEQEKSAEEIERAFDSLFACRYMQDKIGQVYKGKIAGIAEFALFVELENGIEGTLYLSRKKYHINKLTGALESLYGSVLHEIGEDVIAEVTEVNMNEKRIILKMAQN